jgi:hypothetical protein
MSANSVSAQSMGYNLEDLYSYHISYFSSRSNIIYAIYRYKHSFFRLTNFTCLVETVNLLYPSERKRKELKYKKNFKTLLVTGSGCV